MRSGDTTLLIRGKWERRGECKDGRLQTRWRDRESTRAEEKATMSREKACFFSKNSYKKDPPIALDFDHRQFFFVKPDCCAGKCRQESSLFCCCGLRDVKTDSWAFLRFFCFVLLCVFHGDSFQCWQNALCRWETRQTGIVRCSDFKTGKKKLPWTNHWTDIKICILS